MFTCFRIWLKICSDIRIEHSNCHILLYIILHMSEEPVLFWVCRYPNLNKHLYSQMQVANLFKSESTDRDTRSSTYKHPQKMLSKMKCINVKNRLYLYSLFTKWNVLYTIFYSYTVW